MLFSSHAFIFGFLPLALIAFHAARIRFGGNAALGTVALSSLIFYGWWNPPYLMLLGGSMAVNYLFVRLLDRGIRGPTLMIGILVNLAVLGYFKYRNFFLENVGLVLGETWQFEPIFVPLAISFFTFQQIALLCDVSDGKAKVRGVLDFAAFVALFPQLIAGPIVLFREMHQQFTDLRDGAGRGLAMLGPGIVIFALGLFKKVVLADSIGPYADTGFAAAELLTFLEAWAAAIAYSLQLYFDFSGYSDMAVGLGLMLGFTLPINFDTPFRATSMVDFWKRWHITMTRFFMMYLYSPIALAFARYAMERRLPKTREFAVAVAIPIAITFLLSGLWHGAAWTFVAFGAVNAFGLIANHYWRSLKIARLPVPVGWFLTMATVIISFVYFRAASMEEAHLILSAMASPQDLALPSWLSVQAEQLGLPWRSMNFFSAGSYTARLAAWIAILLPLSMLIPNIAKRADGLATGWPTAVATAAMIWLSLALLDRPQAFIYFQF